MPLHLLNQGPYHKGFWAYNPKFEKKNHVALTWKMMIWPGHNFAHVTIAELWWHVQICDLIESLELWLQQTKFSIMST